ncbi:hypothetical protein Ciccas_005606, partial [Cichlidogyrus casuarinus]
SSGNEALKTVQIANEPPITVASLVTNFFHNHSLIGSDLEITNALCILESWSIHKIWIKVMRNSCMRNPRNG